MSDIPELEINPTIGPRLILSDSLGNRKDVCLGVDGSIALSGESVNYLHFPDIEPVIVEEETGTSGWSLKATLNNDGNPISAGDYELTLSFTWRCSTASKSFMAEIDMDGDYDNPIFYMEQRAKSANKNQRQPITKFIRLNGISEGVHTFELWFKCEDSNKIAYMSDVYLKLERKN